MSFNKVGIVAVFAILAGPGFDQAWAEDSHPSGRGEWITIHSPSIEHNAEGNSPDRRVYVVLPPHYSDNSSRRYPVVYFLHGYRGNPQKYDAFMHFAEAVDQAGAQGNDLILVIPDGDSKQGGAMYSNSPTTGDFEDFVVHDVVSFVDSHYRTIAKAGARGLAGHSMGGYGVFRLGMKYPGIFSSLYAMSACCLSQREVTLEGARAAAADDGARDKQRDFALQSDLAAFAAWSPDPTRPPNYIDTGSKGQALDPLVTGRLAANAPLVMLAQYVSALKSYKAIKFDVGDKDMLSADVRAMDKEMVLFGIPHEWEVYDGDHQNRVAERFRSKVLPFFARNLEKN